MFLTSSYQPLQSFIKSEPVLGRASRSEAIPFRLRLYVLTGLVVQRGNFFQNWSVTARTTLAKKRKKGQKKHCFWLISNEIWWNSVILGPTTLVIHETITTLWLSCKNDTIRRKWNSVCDCLLSSHHVWPQTTAARATAKACLYDCLWHLEAGSDFCLLAVFCRRLYLYFCPMNMMICGAHWSCSHFVR